MFVFFGASINVENALMGIFCTNYKNLILYLEYSCFNGKFTITKK